MQRIYTLTCSRCHAGWDSIRQLDRCSCGGPGKVVDVRIEVPLTQKEPPP